MVFCKCFIRDYTLGLANGLFIFVCIEWHINCISFKVNLNHIRSKSEGKGLKMHGLDLNSNCF